MKKCDIMRSFAEFHIKRDVPTLHKFEEPTFAQDLGLEHYILRYFRARPLHQNDQKIAYIVLSEKEYKHLWDNDEIKLTNVDIATSRLHHASVTMCLAANCIMCT